MPPAPQYGSTKAHPTIIDIRHHSQKHDQLTFPCHDLNGTLLQFEAKGQENNKKLANEYVPEQVQCEEPEAEMTENKPNASLKSAILKGLTEVKGHGKTIPTVVLYDDKGLQIYDQITYLEEYYLVQEEIDILTRDSDKIVESIPNGSVVVELGSGSLRKTRVLLDALEEKRENIQYFALDLMRDELTKSLVNLGGYKNVSTAGLWGTYDEGMAFIGAFPPAVPKTILWLGSSIGNLTRAEAFDFISNYRSILNVGDNWLIGIDRRNSAQEITLAYNDPKSVTRDFIMNGLDHVNAILEQPLFDLSKFTYFGTYNETLGRHEAYYMALVSHDMSYHDIDGKFYKISVDKDELINVEYSYKWSLAESAKLFDETKMSRVGQWASSSARYDLHMLRKDPFFLPKAVSLISANTTNQLSANELVSAAPSKGDWDQLWSAWDFVTMEMIAHPQMLLEKPIDLRHPFIFYIGHIPAFLDIHLSRAFNLPLIDPEYYSEIFERGIDPVVEDPSKCHEHSQVPETWPEVSEIITYKSKVVARLNAILADTETFKITRRTARTLFMTFEHQAMHLETILYMLVQSENTKAPPGIRYAWENGTDFIGTSSPTNADWITIDPLTLSDEVLTLGHNDPEREDVKNSDDTTSAFGWDNEHPKVGPSHLLPFQIQTHQVTNGQFLEFLETSKLAGENTKYPKSWKVEHGTIFVRSVFGAVPFAVAKNWPVACSQREALNYIKWIDPQGLTYALATEEQLSTVFKLKQAETLENCNYGFRSWYPLSSLSVSSAEQSDWERFQGPGALWDWTSTPFAPLGKGYTTSQIYPGYSSDFFEGDHYVVLGASWATHPRIAQRRSFRNWYQGNYAYAFIGFRLVRNILYNNAV